VLPLQPIPAAHHHRLERGHLQVSAGVSERARCCGREQSKACMLGCIPLSLLASNAGGSLATTQLTCCRMTSSSSQPAAFHDGACAVHIQPHAHRCFWTFWTTTSWPCGMALTRPTLQSSSRWSDSGNADMHACRPSTGWLLAGSQCAVSSLVFSHTTHTSAGVYLILCYSTHSQQSSRYVRRHLKLRV
jgi:hypothetical protein